MQKVKHILAFSVRMWAFFSLYDNVDLLDQFYYVMQQTRAGLALISIHHGHELVLVWFISTITLVL